MAEFRDTAPLKVGHCLSYSLYLSLYKTDITLKRTFSAGLKSSPLERDDCNYKGLFHGGRGPQIAEVTCGGSSHLSCKRDQLIMRDYMDRRVTLPKRATSSAWGLPHPCKQALRVD